MVELTALPDRRTATVTLNPSTRLRIIEDYSKPRVVSGPTSTPRMVYVFVYARSNAERKPLYRDLLKVATRTVDYAESALPILSAYDSKKARKLHGSIKHNIDLARRIDS